MELVITVNGSRLLVQRFFEIIKVTFGQESSFKYCCENLKWLLIKSFEHLNQIKQASRVDNVGQANPVSHVEQVQHVDNVHLDGLDNGRNVNRLHVGLINGDSIDYNEESGDEVPFINLKRFRLLLLLISFKWLRKMYDLVCHIVRLVCLARLVRLGHIICLICPFCLICLIHHANHAGFTMIITQLYFTMIIMGLGFLWERLGVTLGRVIGVRVWVWFLYGKQVAKLVINNTLISSSSA